MSRGWLLCVDSYGNEEKGYGHITTKLSFYKGIIA